MVRVMYRIPAKPEAFTPEGVAPGCRRISNLYFRGFTGRRIDILVVHTNWAKREGTIQSAVNHANAAPGKNTYPHYQHDRDGDAAKLLDTNRRGIGNAGSAAYWRQYGLPDGSYRALVYETADRGTVADPNPDGSYFTEAQIDALCRDLAYECVVHDIPAVLLDRPDGRGIAGHCFPFPYPAFTTAEGKQCPGHRKYRQLVDRIIPQTAAIVAAWTLAPTPPPVPAPEPPPAPIPAPAPVPTSKGPVDMIPVLRREDGTVVYSTQPGTLNAFRTLLEFYTWAASGLVDVVTWQRVTDPGKVSTVPDQQIADRFGVPVTAVPGRVS